MKLEIKDLWVAALRSGEYKQAQTVLRADGGHCCLGVLCDLYRKTENKGDWLGSYFNDLDDGESDTELTDTVGVWAGTAENDLYIPVTPRNSSMEPEFKSTRTYLAALNDEGMPFAQIADLIEHFYVEL